MRFTCPFCNQELMSIGKQINNKGCQINKLSIDKKQFEDQLASFKEGFRLEMNRRRKQKSRAKQLAEKGPEIIKAEMNKQKIGSRRNLRDQKGPEIIKAEMNKQKINNRKKLIVERGPVHIKIQEN